MKVLNENRLMIEKVVKKETDFLIGEVESLQGHMKGIINYAHDDLEKVDFGKSQVRNLLNAAKNASGVKELVIFIQYQMARDSHGKYKEAKTWRKEDTDSVSLGDKVIVILNKIKARVQDNEVIEQELKNQVVTHLIERFFLYWSWQHKYLETIKPQEKSKGNDRNKSRNNNRTSQHNNSKGGR